MNEDLRQLADLIRQRNGIEVEITRLIGRPAQIGHVGEFIAAQIFDIHLVESASNKAIDGYFQSGTLAGKSVNIKWYGKQESILDITPATLPDLYLVLTGPKSPAVSSRGGSRPWLIEFIYLFDANELVGRIKERGTKIGIATSVPQVLWNEAEIFPTSANTVLVLSEDHKVLLRFFSARN